MVIKVRTKNVLKNPFIYSSQSKEKKLKEMVVLTKPKEEGCIGISENKTNLVTKCLYAGYRSTMRSLR